VVLYHGVHSPGGLEDRARRKRLSVTTFLASRRVRWRMTPPIVLDFTPEAARLQERPLATGVVKSAGRPVDIQKR
jgi:hypothetical protein